MNYRYELLEAKLLKSHEQSIPSLLRETMEAIKKDGYVRQPLLVEDRYYIILDGHHRYEALLELGCKRIPAYLVDYSDDAIQVETWPGAKVDHVSKEDVVEMVMSGQKFPPKTTRHIAKGRPGDRPVRLEDLR